MLKCNSSVSFNSKLFTLIFLCSTLVFAQPIKDIIHPVKLAAGVTDTIYISDLFYHHNYDITFSTHPEIEIEYLKEEGLLILTPHFNFEGLTLVEFLYDERPYQIPVNVEIKQEFTFKFISDEKINRITLMGSFNGWNRESHTLYKMNDTLYHRKVTLDPGRYEYKFVIDGEETEDPANPELVSNGFGGFNSVATVPPRNTKKVYLHNYNSTVTSDYTILQYYYETESKLDSLYLDNVIALIDNFKIPSGHIRINKNVISIMLRGNAIKRNIVIRLAVTRDGVMSNLQTTQLLRGKPAGNNNDEFTWHDAIMYSIMIDRFYDGDPSNTLPVEHPELLPPANYQGGDLKGIFTKMKEGYFDSLGVNVIWISPVNENTDSAYREYPEPHRYYTGYHGYWPIHHQKVEKRFGNMTLLKDLINEGKRKGIKFLLDFVSNHVHEEHPFFQKNRDWFGVLELPDGRRNLRLWDEQRLTTWFEPFMPSFDYDGSKEALEVMTDNATWWLNETGAAGYRHDAVKHVPNSFWRTLTRKIKAGVEAKRNEKVYQIGETFGSYDLINSYVNNGQLDAQFNFNLYDVALPAFLLPDVSFKTLERELEKTHSVYGVNHLMANVMDSHDKPRYMAFADGDMGLDEAYNSEIGWQKPPQVDHPSSYEKLKLYLAYLLTIPGIPVLYYGDEIGMTGGPDPDNRRMMRFDDDLTYLEKNTLEDVKQIVSLRKNHSALRYGDFIPLYADTKCFVYMRSDMNERLLVALNKNEEDETITVTLPSVYKINNAFDVLEEKEYKAENDKLTLSINAIGWKVLKLENK